MFVKLILYVLVFVEMVFAEVNFKNATEDDINMQNSDKIWFTGLSVNQTTITPLRLNKGANYIYKYKETDQLNITCETQEKCNKTDFKFFHAQFDKVIQLHERFEPKGINLDGSSLFCSCVHKNRTSRWPFHHNEVHSIILELKLDRIAKLFFTGLHPDQQKIGPITKYSYHKDEFLNIGCESEVPIETKRLTFYNATTGNSEPLFHSRLRVVGSVELSDSKLTCSYETPEGTHYVIKLKLEVINKNPNPYERDNESAFSMTTIIVITCVVIAAVLIFLFVDSGIVIGLFIESLVLCKSAGKNVTRSLVELGSKVKRRPTEVLPERWTKVVKVEMHADDASIMPIISIERVRYTEFGGKNAGVSSEYILPVDTKWEMPRQNLSFGDVLGEGEFGRVLKAEFIGTADSRLPSIVAVKMLKADHTDSDMTALVSEMEIMKMIGKHRNVVNLLGCCSQDGPLCVVVEYASNGCLREFLNRHDPKCPSEGVSRLEERNLVEFALQVTKGMEFLVSRGCIHRDLAARNVLVSEDLTLKIADFGLARDVRDYAYYRKRTAGRLPVRWMAPESLENNYYTEHSDIWSFGILFWEIMTFGCTPYRKLPVHFLYDYLKTGKRLGRPNGCQKTIYSLMLDCWKFDPEERPRFSQLVIRLQDILNETNKL